MRILWSRLKSLMFSPMAIALFVLMAMAFAVTVGVHLGVAFIERPHRVSDLMMSEYRVVVTGRLTDMWGVWNQLEYEIYRNGKLVVHEELGGTTMTLDSLRFKLLPTLDSGFIVMSNEYAPETVAMIYDTKSGERYPREEDEGDVPKDEYNRARKMLAKVKYISNQPLKFDFDGGPSAFGH